MSDLDKLRALVADLADRSRPPGVYRFAKLAPALLAVIEAGDRCAEAAEDDSDAWMRRAEDAERRWREARDALRARIDEVVS